ncbi:hypothetical protein P152DRAFT_383465, partial [Eremomyces bilateralis CBS 781.70]
RSFSSSPRARSIAPESPRFIDIPQPPQRDVVKRPIVKGVLPVPRQVFRSNTGNNMIDPKTLSLSTMEPSNPEQELDTDTTTLSRRSYKARAAQTRRQNLRQGVMDLYTRQETQRTRSERKQAAIFKAHNAARVAPERDDERFTRTTVPQAVLDLLTKQPTSGRKSDPEAMERSRMNYQRDLQKKSERRREALQSLYVHARNFIVNEAQLDEAIEKTFGTEEKPIRWSTGSWSKFETTSIWAMGTPDTTNDMLARLNREGDSKTTQRIRDRPMGTSSERLKKIAEVLTGGK